MTQRILLAWLFLVPAGAVVAADAVARGGSVREVYGADACPSRIASPSRAKACMSLAPRK